MGTYEKKKGKKKRRGVVEAIDSDGNIIIADTIIYKKSEEFLLAEGNVKVIDNEENILLSKKASYDKINGLIRTYGNTELVLKKGYQNIEWIREEKPPFYE